MKFMTGYSDLDRLLFYDFREDGHDACNTLLMDHSTSRTLLVSNVGTGYLACLCTRILTYGKS